MSRRGALAIPLLALTAAVPSFAQETPKLLPGGPNSDARWEPIERFKREAPPLAASFEARTYRDAAGETMPYRLFKPKTEPGRLYPLVLFLHGSSGSGTDNVKQLDRGNWFGSLVWGTSQVPGTSGPAGTIVVEGGSIVWGDSAVNEDSPPPAVVILSGTPLAL